MTTPTQSAWESIGPSVWRNTETMHKMCVTEISQHKLYSAFSPNNYHLGTFEDRARALHMCEVCNQESIEWLKAYQSGSKPVIQILPADAHYDNPLNGVIIKVKEDV